MSEGFAYIDILFFAMVAAFIAFRLRSVLGRKTGHERRRTGGFGDVQSGAGPDNVVPIGDRGEAMTEIDPAIAALGEGDVKNGLTSIHEADQLFDLREFLSGGRLAFEMIVDAYAAGDKAVLRPLLADQVFRGFARAIDERVAVEQTLDTQLLAVSEPEVIEADLVGSVARLTLRFESEQVNVVRDRDGKVIEGDPQAAESIVDLWTFERDTVSSDPNWTLVETRAPN